jgi:drug/metabolite transporter (DMT)-like permease
MSNLFLYVVTVTVWGSTWIAIEYQLGTVAPEVSIFYRYLLASALLFVGCAARGRQLRFALRHHIRFATLGLLLFSLNYVLTYHAQAYISSALTAIAFSAMLWINLLNARVFFGMRPSGSILGGSLLGIAGICTLFLPEARNLALDDTTVIGTGLALLGAFVASLGNMVSQAAQGRGLPIVQSNAWGMLYGALFTGFAALMEGQLFTFDWSPTYVGSLAYLAVFGSIVGFGSYLTLLGRIGAGKAGYAMVMFPVVAIAISLVVGEIQPSWDLAVGALLVVAGNVMVLKSTLRSTDRQRLTPAPAAVHPDVDSDAQSSPPCQEMNFQSPSSRTSTSV